MATLREVAEVTGVSIGTVSRVVNGQSGVGEATRTRVQDVLRRMHYEANVHARSLRTGSDPDFGPGFALRSREHVIDKQRIAQAALRFVHGQRVVCLDSGSTVAELAKLIRNHPVVWTNSLATLQPLSKNEVAVNLAPGQYVPSMSAVFGSETVEYFRRLAPSALFLSTHLVDVDNGLYNVHPLTVSVKEAMLASSELKVLLVDHSKFCRNQLPAFAPLSAVDVLITDFVPDEYHEAILNSGVKLISLDTVADV